MFYPPPPTFIGGRQPYAPPLGQVQSGPAASALVPYDRRSQEIAASAWRYMDVVSGRQPYLRSKGLVQSGPIANAPPPSFAAAQQTILRSWNQPDYMITIDLPSVAPFLSNPVTPDAPPLDLRAQKVRGVIYRSWIKDTYQIPSAGRLAALIPAPATPDDPPVSTRVVLRSILEQHQPAKWWPLPQRLRNAVLAVLPDGTPNSFTIPPQTGVALTSPVTFDAVIVSGINIAVAVSVSGSGSPQYSVNGGAFTGSAGSVVNGDSVVVKHTSSGAYSTPVTSTLNIGGVTADAVSTTIPDPSSVLGIRRRKLGNPKFNPRS